MKCLIIVHAVGCNFLRSVLVRSWLLPFVGRGGRLLYETDGKTHLLSGRGGRLLYETDGKTHLLSDRDGRLLYETDGKTHLLSDHFDNKLSMGTLSACHFPSGLSTIDFRSNELISC